ncbi:Uncharacterised protein [Catenibacterium mitsuokai]|uniref:tetratricopeptide repeat protein n=1 Tax=Catenibacterium mitsuokai TaxID=100886 RepID=UPI0006C136D4|nr:hypothetical protein [Catenibacterium mitsuokai]CUP33889.1 Uncharacterised protein [Catenibacterium mitsuokai]
MKTKNNKMIATAIAIILLVIAIIISLVFVFNNRHSAKDYNNKLDEAQKYVAKLDYKKAEATYLKAIDINPKQPTAYVELADVYVTVNKQDKAEDILEKGYKNVEGKENKKIIKDKQEEIKDGMNAINNGGDYVTYRGKNYYWEYKSNSFDASNQRAIGMGRPLIYANASNDLVCVDDKGNKKTIYSGKNKGSIWIFNNRIYVAPIDTYSDNCTSMDLDGSNTKEEYFNTIYAVRKEGLVVGNTGDDGSLSILKNNDKLERIAYAHFNSIKVVLVSDTRVYYTTNADSGINFECVDLDGKNNVHLATLTQSSWCDWSDDYEMRVPVTVDCAQEIGDEVYFQFGGYDGSGYIYQGGKIAKVKTDGTGFTEIKSIDGEDEGCTAFTAYKSGNKVEIKQGGTLNKPFIEYDAGSESYKAVIYTEDGSKKELLSGKEYASYGNDLESLSYTGDELYFVAVKVDDNYTQCLSYAYCKKDLKTNKITVYQKVNI